MLYLQDLILLLSYYVFTFFIYDTMKNSFLLFLLFSMLQNIKYMPLEWKLYELNKLWGAMLFRVVFQHQRKPDD